MKKAALFVCWLSLVTLTVKAEPVADALDSAQSLVETVAANAQQNNRDQAIADKKDELLGLLAQVDERYGDVAASLKSIETEIARTNESLAKLRKESSAYQDEINRLSHELSGQIKAAYAMGQQERLKLILNQQDPALSSRMMIYYEYLNKSRLTKLANLKNTVGYLDKLDKLKQAQTDELNQNLGQKKTQQAALDEVRKQRNGLIAKLHSAGSSEQTQLSFLRENEVKLINLIKTLENDSSPTEVPATAEDVALAMNSQDGESFPKLTGDFSSLKGQLPLPVQGKVSSMRETASDAEGAWQGVLINAQEGTEIRAITGGKVIYAGILKGYGLLSIVEHNKNFMTLYAFNQSLHKHKGEQVDAGDVIATVGQSGGRHKPGLYFEIRHNGKPVDPLLWCRN